jgi:hypothetical protein
VNDLELERLEDDIECKGEDGNDGVPEFVDKGDDGAEGVCNGDDSEGKDEGIAKVSPAPRRARKTEGCMGCAAASKMGGVGL